MRGTLSTLEGIRGRMLDHFALPDGRLVHPYDVVRVLIFGNDWIRQYDPVRERVDRVVVRIVPLVPPPEGRVARIETRVREVLGQDVDVTVTLVPGITQEPSGKFGVSRSLVRSLYDDASTAGPR